MYAISGGAFTYPMKKKMINTITAKIIPAIVVNGILNGISILLFKI
jgi:hypothetical protein